MGRIFETRKHTMFARWDRMAKAFTRIGKEITIAVKAGRARTRRQPAAAPRDPERPRGQHAEGQGRAAIKRASGQERGRLRGVPLRGLRAARRRHPRRDRDRQPDAHRRQHPHALQQGRRQPRQHRQRRLPVQAHGRLPAEPDGHRPGDARARADRLRARGDGRDTGEKGEPQLVIRCAFTDFGHAAEGARGPRHHADLGRVRVHPADAGRAAREGRPTRCSSSIDRLEQDDDVQKVFHNLA